MDWIMREEFKIAYEKAKLVLDKLNFSGTGMVRTASIIDVVEELTGIDVKFGDFDFGQFSEASNLDMNNYGAAMCISGDSPSQSAVILLNKNGTPAMKRFSLVHELGHLITNKGNYPVGKYRVSTHIDMDITSIPDEVLNEKNNAFLIEEQIANIFALLVLIPYKQLVESWSNVILNKKRIQDVATEFGVEPSALISRMKLEEV